ncbi:MAG: hypothetical protein JWO95_322 [Verrucomicrobiales bacterium]|nr:hypothetical protein [Verrucomicrobiales bacterium]
MLPPLGQTHRRTDAVNILMIHALKRRVLLAVNLSAESLIAPMSKPDTINPVMNSPRAIRGGALLQSILLLVFLAIVPNALRAQSPVTIYNFSKVGSVKNLRFQPYPSAAAYTFLGSTNVTLLTADPSFVLSPYFLSTVTITNSPTNIVTLTNYGYEWRTTNNLPLSFYQVQVTPMDSNVVLAAHVLNRLAYGPTPNELDRVTAMGADAYINEQLNPENITETADSLPSIVALQNKLAGPTKIIDLARNIQSDTNGVVTNVICTSTNASMSDLRAWHTLRAVYAKRQLVEILLQFLENHFVTQYSKSSTYFNGKYNGDDNIMEDRVSTQLEYLENLRWRQALLDPSCTFSNLLTISSESLAMIIYLDTVTSSGNGSNVANENYAREIQELFTMGVDNGYDQSDITTMSRAWSGWTSEIIDPAQVGNRFATQTTNDYPFVTNNFSAVSNLAGVWNFVFKSTTHNTATKYIYYTTNNNVPISKTVPARFGSPWAGRSYGLAIPARSGTNGLQDGYDIIAQLSNLPFTEEYISVKLCNLFVHDGFSLGYDFTDPNLSPDGQLVHSCMLAWENSSPKGNIRSILSTIFNSDLFRNQASVMAKVKTPLEIVVSTVRAISITNAATASTDGYSFTLPMDRMGSMDLFDRNDPNGYPEDAQGWISGGTLAERVRFIQSFCIASGTSGHSGAQSGTGNDAGNCICNPVLLISSKMPSSGWYNESSVADYLLKILFPTEGAGNLTLYKSAVVNYLSTDDNGAASALNTISAANYDTRIRGAVGLLMSFARFQEQ